MRTIPKGQGFYKWLEAQDMSGGSCFSFPAQCKVECQQVTLHGGSVAGAVVTSMGTGPAVEGYVRVKIPQPYWESL